MGVFSVGWGVMDSALMISVAQAGPVDMPAGKSVTRRDVRAPPRRKIVQYRQGEW